MLRTRWRIAIPVSGRATLARAAMPSPAAPRPRPWPTHAAPAGRADRANAKSAKPERPRLHYDDVVAHLRGLLVGGRARRRAAARGSRKVRSRRTSLHFREMHHGRASHQRPVSLSFPLRRVAPDNASGAEQLIEQWLFWRARLFKSFLYGKVRAGLAIDVFLHREAVRLPRSGD